MKFLLDTNICIYVIRKKPRKVVDRLRKQKVGDVAISTVTLSELLYGVEKSSRPDANRQALAAFALPLVVLPYGPDCATFYGRIRADLEKKGTPIGPLDTLIAAHALAAKATLVTNNLKEFQRVPGLRVANWASP